MQDNIYDIRGTKFYLPDTQTDCIQASIRLSNDYWDMPAHHKINQFLIDNAIILDIGANIGSHTLYWAKERQAKKIYSFEPFKRMFDILKKNIELNSLEDTVTIFNVGLSDEVVHASPNVVFEGNLGGTSFVKNNSGESLLKPLDSFEFEEKIDLVKIDVEGHEVQVLKGAVNTLKKHRPIIVIETFTNKAAVDDILSKLGYRLFDTIREGEDYIYKCIYPSI